jgi:anti-sigma regulatory factor (Ser/Thr protein kinase)
MSRMKTSPRPRTINLLEHASTQPGETLLVLKLHSDPKMLAAVRGAVERLAETLGFPAAQCRSVTRAVDEALSNILKHCYSGRPGQPISIYFQCIQRRQQNRVEQGLEILLRDHGPRIPAGKLHGRPLDEIRPGGLGLHFIHQAMDTVEFSRKGTTNQLRLVKYLAQKKNSF